MKRNELQQLTLSTTQYNLNNRTFHKRDTINEGKSKEVWLFVLKSQAINPVLLDCFRNFLAKADVTQADE